MIKRTKHEICCGFVKELMIILFLITNVNQQRFPIQGGVTFMPLYEEVENETDLSNKTAMFQMSLYTGANTYCNKSMSPM